jgi:hypothetical protein
VPVYDAPNNGPESVYLTGDYEETGTFCATTLTSLGWGDVFVWKLNSGGAPAGTKSLGKGVPDTGRGHHSRWRGQPLCDGGDGARPPEGK